jgi:hypothetical protein
MQVARSGVVRLLAIVEQLLTAVLGLLQLAAVPSLLVGLARGVKISRSWVVRLLAVVEQLLTTVLRLLQLAALMVGTLAFWVADGPMTTWFQRGGSPLLLRVGA